jgi:ParB family transcriptional regulator, chromosome partitioning protein
MESKALGKGLAALIPENVFEENPKDINYLKISLIADNAFQPRQKYDEEKINELKESIRQKGILQPILVRKKGTNYEVIAGERRLRAARALNLTEVPVIIKNVSDEEALILALIENIQREELNAIEEAMAIKNLSKEFGLSQEEIAKSLGKDRSTISNLLRLLRLPAEIQNGIVSGIVSMGHARALIGIEDAQQQKKLYQKIIDNGLSVREIENLAKEHLILAGKRKTETENTKDPEIVLLESELQQILGTKVRVATKRKRGEVIIEYYSLEDLERILRIIKK